MTDWFRRFAHKVSATVGSPLSFVFSVFVIACWALLGSAFNYSDTWQLVINTGTTIITFLMVFLIQNTQNRDARSIHLKLDELIYSNKDARNLLIDLEELSDNELDKIHSDLIEMKNRAEAHIQDIQKTRQKNKKVNYFLSGFKAKPQAITSSNIVLISWSWTAAGLKVL